MQTLQLAGASVSLQSGTACQRAAVRWMTYSTDLCSQQLYASRSCHAAADQDDSKRRDLEKSASKQDDCRCKPDVESLQSRALIVDHGADHPGILLITLHATTPACAYAKEATTGKACAS